MEANLSFVPEAMLERLAADSEFGLAIRLWSADVAIEIGADAYLLSIEDGQVRRFARERTDRADVRLAGTQAQWQQQLVRVPLPYWHDPLMGVVFGEGPDAEGRVFRIEGDEFAHVFPYYPAIQRLVEVFRETVNGGPVGDKTLPPVQRRFDAAVGRYAYVDVLGVQYRVYFEEAGTGIPVLCQHTAGSDGRQYRHLLEDEDLTRRYRFIAYDLPYHGRSLPPTGIEWWQSDYRLTQEFLLEFVVRFAHALELQRPVFMGCSVGGFLAPDLALHRPQEFRAVIGMNSAVYFGQAAVSNMTRSFAHPRLSSAWKAATMRGQTAPATPEALRREIAWCYSQGAPTVFAGDLNYYIHDHDLRGQLDAIDTRMVAVYILVGEYDRLRVAPLGSRAVADGIPGAHYAVVPQGGHFFMCENPAEFKRVITPILREIEETTR